MEIIHTEIRNAKGFLGYKSADLSMHERCRHDDELLRRIIRDILKVLRAKIIFSSQTIWDHTEITHR